MKKIQVTVEIPDELSTIDHLELYVNQLGQEFKRKAFSALASELIDQERQTDSDVSSCPACKKKGAFR